MKWLVTAIRIVLASFLAAGFGIVARALLILRFGQTIGNIIGYWELIPAIGLCALILASMSYGFRWVWQSTTQ